MPATMNTPTASWRRLNSPCRYMNDGAVLMKPARTSRKPTATQMKYAAPGNSHSWSHSPKNAYVEAAIPIISDPMRHSVAHARFGHGVSRCQPREIPAMSFSSSSNPLLSSETSKQNFMMVKMEMDGMHDMFSR